MSLTEEQIKHYGNAGHYDRESGEFHADPHAPYWWSDGWESGYGICFQNQEEYTFGTFETKDEAEWFVALLNKNYCDRKCQWGDDGTCRVCGELSPQASQEQEEAERLLYVKANEEAWEAAQVEAAEAELDYQRMLDDALEDEGNWEGGK